MLNVIKLLRFQGMAEGQEGSPTPRPDGPGPEYYVVLSRILQMDFREGPSVLKNSFALISAPGSNAENGVFVVFWPFFLGRQSFLDPGLVST